MWGPYKGAWIITIFQKSKFKLIQKLKHFCHKLGKKFVLLRNLVSTRYIMIAASPFLPPASSQHHVCF